jgi:nitrogen fixation NifU-like protein
MKISLKIKDGKIEDARFKTFGCGSAIASSSMATELIKGRTIEEAMQLNNQDVVKALGGLPPVKIHCSVLAEEAIKAALEDYQKRRPQSPPPPPPQPQPAPAGV